MSNYTGHLQASIAVDSGGPGVVSQLRGWLQTLRTVLRRNHERRTAIRALSALSDRQLEDIGVIRVQIPEIVQTLSTPKTVETRVADKKVGTARFGAGYCTAHG
ncbi:MAG: DUF1127 domain-containing protein [Proteobacteria bacterium]|nr:MAG: DUF1127 domain-containing protein [Pseudomonadota bacterium]TDJ70528.1 MAG: DUF1127 domain-containing protein [Pseudomonadota bacterium]